MAIIKLPISTERVPARLNIGMMIFVCCAVTYMMRVNMSVNILAMVQPPLRNHTGNLECAEPDAPVLLGNNSVEHEDISDVRPAPKPASSLAATFDWSEGQQSSILGSYFYGYLLTSLLGGVAAERWGSRRVVFVTTLIAGVLTAVTVPAAHAHYIALIVVRFIIGLAGGFIYPALHALVAQWAPPTERSKFISALTGGTLGTVATWSITGPIIETFGWHWAFYIASIVSFMFCAVWLYLVADTPDDHLRISDEERKYIRDALGSNITKEKNFPPLLSILTSLPFLAMVVLHYGNMWGLYFIMTVGPKFVSNVLGFELSKAGVVSALPYLMRLLSAFLFGLTGDFIVRRHLMSTTVIRKSFVLFSHVIPGLLLVALQYTGCSKVWAVTLISMSMGWNGAATLTNLQNHQDLAPNYAGTLYGVANFVGGTAGFITPIITAYYTKHGNSFSDWQPVFFIGASVYIVSALFFVLFGSGQTQSWNNSSSPENKPASDQKDDTKKDITLTVTKD